MLVPILYTSSARIDLTVWPDMRQATLLLYYGLDVPALQQPRAPSMTRKVPSNDGT